MCHLSKGYLCIEVHINLYVGVVFVCHMNMYVDFCVDFCVMFAQTFPKGRGWKFDALYKVN